MFTDVLRSLRKKHGDTQESLAGKINVPVRTYASWERSEREMPHDVLVSIADLYGVTVDYLLGREESPKEVLWGPIKENHRPLMLDGVGVKGWPEDRPETQMVAAKVFSQALNSGVSKEETISFFHNFSQLTPEERKTIMSNMMFLRSQRNEEEGK